MFGVGVVVADAGMPFAITLDHGAGHIYWAARDIDGIRRATYTGQLIEDVFVGGAELVHSIALHPPGGSSFADCNNNGTRDGEDISSTTSQDCNENLVPDECELDCNGNAEPDECDLSSGTSIDCNANGIPDECDIGDATSDDINGNGTPDECEGDLDPDLSFTFSQIGNDEAHSVAINNFGEIAYRDDVGVYFDDGKSLTLKVSNDDLVEFSTGCLRLNDAAQIGMLVMRVSTNRWEILRIEPGQVAADVDDFTEIAVASGFPFESFSFIGDMTNDGSVIFKAEGPVPTDLFIGDGTGSIYDPTSFRQPFPKPPIDGVNGNARPALSNSGLAVAISGLGSDQLVAGSPADLPLNPDASDYIVFNSFWATGLTAQGPVVASDDGMVAFTSGQPPQHLYRSDGVSQVELALNINSSARNLAMNSKNEVLFLRGSMTNFGTALLLTDGLVEVSVAQANDIIDGRTIDSLTIGRESLNGSRQVVFGLRYEELGEFKTVYYLATPNEP